MRQFGFTIVELLVVIAILAVIMALLFPALNTARLHTRALVCSSNIKQILSFLTIYEQQNGAFPYGFDDSMLFSAAPTEYYPGNVTYGDKRGKWWFQQLDDMFNTECKDDRILWCPSRCVKDPTSKRNILCGNYGVNRSICKDADGITGMLGSKYVGKPLSISKIPSPSNAILVIDSGYSLISWEVATDTIINGPEIPRPDSFYIPGMEVNGKRVLLPGNKDDAVYGRHINKTVNIGYVDSHIKRLRADKLFITEVKNIYTSGFQF